MKKQWYKQLLAVVLAFALLMQVVPARVWATMFDSDDVGTTSVGMIFKDAPVTIVGEVESLRTETEKHFRLSNGNNIAVSYGMPVHYQNAEGKWIDIDNTLLLSVDQSTYMTTESNCMMSFAADLTTGKVLTTSYSGASVSMSLLDQSQAKYLVANVATFQARNLATYNRTAEAIVVSDISVFADITRDAADMDKAWSTEDLIPEKLQSSIVYEDVYPGVDLLYTAYGYNIKEQIIVNEKQAQYCYDFLLQTDGLNAVLNDDNSISLADEGGNVIYSIPAPYMADAVGNTSADVEYSLTQVTEGYVLTVEASTEWINAKERVFPVAIDPTIENMAVTKDENLYVTYVTEGSPEVYHPGYQQLYFGYGAAASSKEGRIFMHISELPTIPDGSVVTDAQISLYLYNYTHVNCSEIGAAIYEVTEDKPENHTYKWWIQYMDWNDQPAYDTSNMIDYTIIKADQRGFQDWNITELIKKWYLEGTENRTMAMAITPGTKPYSANYCAGPVFMAYGSSRHPIVSVTYQNNVGIEDYYTYATLGGGEAGTAYLSDATGQLTVVKGLVSYASSINPFAMSLVYNSNYFAQEAAKEHYPTEKMGLSMRLGLGWTLDVIQKIEPITVNEVQYMKYTDGDGTVHYFLDDPDDEDSAYRDEDGLGLKVTINTDGTYIMSDMQDNTYTFNNDGFLTNIRDNNNNQYLINYSNGKLTSIAQKNNGCSEITVASFAYTGDYLSAITDAAGVVHTISYVNNRIDSIINGSTEIAHYRYDGNRLIGMAETQTEYVLRYNYNEEGKVCRYEERTIDGSTGASVHVQYDGCDQTSYQDCGNDRRMDTEDDIFTYYLFDYAGRTVNAYSTDAMGRILGASNAVYTGVGTVDKRNNRTLRTASIGMAAEQELINSGFEYWDATYQWALSGTITRNTEKPRTGAYALKGVLANEVAYVTAKQSSQTLYAGQTYTLSAYVNTTGMNFVSKKGIYLTAKIGDRTWNSDYMHHKTTENVDDGWTRISMTFTAPTTGVYTVGLEAIGGSGVFYVDDFQLENGDGPSNRNLLENGNFQAEGYGWTFGSGGEFRRSFGMSRGIDEAIAPVIASSPLNQNANISQTVIVNLPGTETYVLSGWGAANAVPDNVDTAEDWAQDTTKTFGLRAILTYTDGTTEYTYIPFNADITGWQFTSTMIIPGEPSKTVATITVVCAYEKNGNNAGFDNISLVRQMAQSMSYDEDGNLTSTGTTGMVADSNTYENGNLIKTTTGTGSEIRYTYDETFEHRILSYTDDLTTNSMFYDEVGNVVCSILTSNTDNTLKMVSESHYWNKGNLLDRSVDINGIETIYEYSSDLNKMMALPSAVIDANRTRTNIYYDNFGRTTLTQVANRVTLEYTYSEGNLSEIIRNDRGEIQTYSFEYDAFGNMTRLCLGGRLLATYEYGVGNGPLVKQTYGNGTSITFEYDNLGRIKTATYSDGGKVSYFYTGDGQLYCVKENQAAYYYTYDVTGQLVASEKRDHAGDMLMRVDLQYDDYGQLVGQTWNVGGTVYSESYTYAEDGALSSMTTATGQTLHMNYDVLRRLSSVSSDLYTKSYTYQSVRDKTTNLVSQLQYTGLPTSLAFGYTYDALGNIATYTAPDGEVITYVYDEMGQLRRAVGDQTYTYTYDSAGNIRSANGHTYSYGDANWKDLLTAFDGETITYDASGNPLSYYNGTRWNFTWKNGRNLASASSANGSLSFEYDSDGLRTKKTVSGEGTHYYFYASGQLLRESYSGNFLDFSYDANGYPYALKYNGTTYYYITNLQGDVMYMVDGTGATVASYEYDPFGNILSATGEMAEINPLRYRGYYYDAELEMYYLQSRYYDPMVGRFINADDVALLGLSGTELGYNLFAYCENNPINNSDSTGYVITPANVIGAVIGVIGGAVIGTAIANYFRLTGWKKWACTASVSALIGVVGYFAGPSIYAAIRPIVIKAITACTVFFSSAQEWVLRTLGIAQTYINQALRLVNEKTINFTKTVLNHLSNPDRHVPIKMIIDCIKTGSARPDQQGTNAIMYTIDCFYRNGNRYYLEVLFDWATKTVLHFKYWEWK